MSKRPWMPLYIGDIKRKTDDLGPTQYGIYMRLLEWAWDHDGKIPLDATRLSNITRCDRRFWTRFGAPIVARFFDTVDGSTAIQKRVVTELLRSGEISNKRKAAALQMHSKSRANAPRLHDGLHTQSQSQSINKTVTVTTQSIAPGARARSNGSHGAGSKLSQAEQDRLIAKYEAAHGGRPWQETMRHNDGMSPEKPPDDEQFGVPG